LDWNEGPEKHASGDKEVVEKGMILEERPEKHASGAKALFIPLC
jgi:hypothetical protein